MRLGKTVVFNTIAREEPSNVLILAHRDELLEQARKKYQTMFGELPGKIKAGENEIRRVTVGSIQTMSRRQYAPDLFPTIIVDEAHHAMSDEYQRLLQQFPGSRVLGVTATPSRSDKRNLANYFESIAYEYKLKQAIQDGYLVPIRARTVPLQIDLNNVKVSVGDFEVTGIARALEPYLEQIADAIVRYAARRKTVVFLPLVKISQEFCEMLNRRGINAVEVNGNSPDRVQKLADFNSGKYKCLCNAMLLTEGWDCPSVDCVVVLRPTKVTSLYQQMVGRGSRLFPGKTDLLLLDFLWLTYRHNLCRPASFIADNEEDIKAVMHKSESEEIDLFDALSDAEDARRNTMAEALEKQRRKKSKLVDPMEIFSLLDDIGLADYQPSFSWEEQDATAKQIATLQSFGIDADGISKGYACAVLERLIGRSNRHMATLKQVKLLKLYGYTDAANWTFDQASARIGALAASGWRRR